MDLININYTQINQHIYINRIDHCWYYITSVTNFSPERYSLLDSLSSHSFNIYMITKEPEAIIRYALPDNPISWKTFFETIQVTDNIIVIVLKQIIETIKLLHSKNVYHGNITEETIFIDPNTYNATLVDCLFPQYEIETDPILTDIQNIKTIQESNEFFEKDLSSIPLLLLNYFGIESIQDYLEQTHSSISQTFPQVDQFLHVYLTSPTPLSTVSNLLQSVSQNIKSLIEKNPLLFLRVYGEFKYNEHHEDDEDIEVLSDFSLNSIPTLPHSFIQSSYITLDGKQCKIYQQNTIENNRNNNVINNNLIDKSNKNINEQNILQQMILQTPQRKRIIIIPQLRLIAQNVLLMKLSTRIRSYGYIVECKKKVTDINIIQPSPEILILDREKELKGYFIPLNESIEIETLPQYIQKAQHINNFYSKKELFSILSSHKMQYHTSTAKFFSTFTKLNTPNNQMEKGNEKRIKQFTQTSIQRLTHQFNNQSTSSIDKIQMNDTLYSSDKNNNSSL